MTNENEIDLTPITRTKRIIWRVEEEKLLALRDEIVALIEQEGIVNVYEGTGINPVRLSCIADLPHNERKTTRTLIKLCKYFNITSERFARKQVIWT